jgi:hypothetical protein
MYKETKINNYQAANNPSKPLDNLPRAAWNKELLQICFFLDQITNLQ